MADLGNPLNMLKNLRVGAKNKAQQGNGNLKHTFFLF